MASTNTPASLHKYFPPERIDSLERLEIAFSPLNSFNDPFEGRPEIHGMTSDDYLVKTLRDKFPAAMREKYDALPKERKDLVDFDTFSEKMLAMADSSLAGEAEKFQTFLTAFAKTIPDQMSKIMGAMCLCETKDSLLMWAHYAKSHTGFVIEFDTSSPFFNRMRTDKDENYHLRRVLYRSRRPSGHVIDFDGTELFLVKSDDWAYEKEWRIFAPLGEADREVQAGGNTVSLFTIPIDCIKSVTIGARAPDYVQSAVCAFAINSRAHKISVYQAIPSPSHFMLDFEKLAI